MKRQIEIKKFARPEFGELTTFTNPNSGKVMFIGKEIAEMWGHTDLSKAIKDAKLNKDEYKVIRLINYPQFKKDVSDCGLVTSRMLLFSMVCSVLKIENPHSYNSSVGL